MNKNIARLLISLVATNNAGMLIFGTHQEAADTATQFGLPLVDKSYEGQRRLNDANLRVCQRKPVIICTCEGEIDLAIQDKYLCFHASANLASC